MPNLKVIGYSECKKNSDEKLFCEMRVPKHDHFTSDWSTHLITSVFYKNINFPIKCFLIKNITSK